MNTVTASTVSLNYYRTALNNTRAYCDKQIKVTKKNRKHETDSVILPVDTLIDVTSIASIDEETLQIRCTAVLPGSKAKITVYAPHTVICKGLGIK